MTKKTATSRIQPSGTRNAGVEHGPVKSILPPELSNCGLPAIDTLTNHHRTLGKGEYLYHMGDPLSTLYIIRSGSIKTSRLTRDGRIQVIGFHVPGELLGIDAIGESLHPSNAIALESSTLSEIPYYWLEQLSYKTPSLQRALMQLLSREIVRDEELMVMLGRQNAEARLASCILSLVKRTNHTAADRRIRLPMSRQDLADHLGLALETVSRLFTRLQAQGILRVDNRQIQLLDPARLEDLVEQCSSSYRLHS
jgi:CRP/FNR family transcriptional regulator